MKYILDETRTCFHCGRTLRATGYTMYQVVFEECPCERERRERQAEEDRRERQAREARQASCNHRWTQVYRCGFAVKRCPICGAEEQGVV